MNKIVLKNILMNFILMVFFVILNNRALQNGLEETFVSLALVYGIIVILANAIFAAKFLKK